MLDFSLILWYNLSIRNERKGVSVMSINEIKNLDEAIALIQSLQSENAWLKNKVEQQDVRISNLTEMLIKSQKKMFGKSSEQTKYIDGSEQLSLFNEA